ncbi:unnamed protein product [Caenorhabditis bovis]|uniref:Uncharacterized protein n=1 Tax=Caenorhabditis bovis TaxID=2654633 RepID=A0A8S1F5R3_9PELO|nr:unnamed protein product [Caenorhabditis bovis]
METLLFGFTFTIFILSLFSCSKNGSKSRSTSSDVKNGEKTPKNCKTEEANNKMKAAKKPSDDEDIKFNINIKKDEKKDDVFDDDEENPVAKLELRKKKPPSTATTPSSNTPIEKKSQVAVSKKPSMEKLGGEQPVLAINEKAIGMSCYVPVAVRIAD